MWAKMVYYLIRMLKLNTFQRVNLLHGGTLKFCSIIDQSNQQKCFWLGIAQIRKVVEEKYISSSCGGSVSSFAIRNLQLIFPLDEGGYVEHILFGDTSYIYFCVERLKMEKKLKMVNGLDYQSKDVEKDQKDVVIYDLK